MYRHSCAKNPQDQGERGGSSLADRQFGAGKVKKVTQAANYDKRFNLAIVPLRRAHAMFDWLSNDKNVFWLAIAAMCIVPSVLYYMRKMKKDEQQTSLKRDMIARGMSAEEIERVLAAKGKANDEDE
jgi:hypothetical protein